MNEAILKHIFESRPGHLLYHYTSVNAAKAILAGKEIWLSEFSRTNDKSEYTYAKLKFLEAYRNRDAFIQEIPRYMLGMILESHEPSTMMMIGCLTEKKDDLSLWDRYADRGQGCVIGIDAHWLATRAGVAIRRVCYDVGYLKNFVNIGCRMLQDQYETEPVDLSVLRDLASSLVMDLYAFKDPRFESESEVRISRLTLANSSCPFGLKDNGGHRDDGTNTNSLPILRRDGCYGDTRYIKLPLGEDEHQTAIRSIGFGPRFNNEKEEFIQASLLQEGSVNVWASDIPFR